MECLSRMSGTRPTNQEALQESATPLPAGTGFNAIGFDSFYGGDSKGYTYYPVA